MRFAYRDQVLQALRDDAATRSVAGADPQSPPPWADRPSPFVVADPTPPVPTASRHDGRREGDR